MIATFVLVSAGMSTVIALGDMPSAATPDAAEGYVGLVVIPRLIGLSLSIGLCLIADIWLLLGVWRRWPISGLAPGLILGVLAVLVVLA